MHIIWNRILLLRRMTHLAKALFINVVECILQNRVAVHKKQMLRFNEVNKQIKKHRAKAYNGDLTLFLKELLLEQRHNMESRVHLDNEFESASIVFQLTSHEDRQAIEAEIWTIEFQQFMELDQDNKQAEFEVIISLFEELLIFLNQQPLFQLYQRDTFLKKNFNLTHQLGIGQDHTTFPPSTDNIVNLRQKYVLERSCRSFVIHICCYLSPNFESLHEDYDKQPLIPSKAEVHGSSTSHSETQKSSVFEFYDPDLDFMFLSSEDESFNSPSLKIDLTDYMKNDDEEFEMLIASKDEQFVCDHQNLFSELSSTEKTYLNSQH